LIIIHNDISPIKTIFMGTIIRITYNTCIVDTGTFATDGIVHNILLLYHDWESSNIFILYWIRKSYTVGT